MLDFFLLVAWFKSCKSFSCFHWGLDQDLSRELLLSVWFSCYLLHESGERDHVPPGLYKVCSVLRHACKFQNVNHTLKAEVTLKKNSRLDFLSHWRWLSHRKKSSEMEKPGTLWNSLETETYSPMTMSRPRQSSKWLLCSGFLLMVNCNAQGIWPTAHFFQCSLFAWNFTHRWGHGTLPFHYKALLAQFQTYKSTPNYHT